jgi:pilus assembly protein CpaC
MSATMRKPPVRSIVAAALSVSLTASPCWAAPPVGTVAVDEMMAAVKMTDADLSAAMGDADKASPQKGVVPERVVVSQKDARETKTAAALPPSDQSAPEFAEPPPDAEPQGEAPSARQAAPRPQAPHHRSPPKVVVRQQPAPAVAPAAGVDLNAQAKALLDSLHLNDAVSKPLVPDRTAKLTAGGEQTVNIPSGSSATIVLPGKFFDKAVVVMPDIADVVLIGDGHAQIVAKGNGTTDVVFSNPDGDVFKAHVVVALDAAPIQQAMDTVLKDEHIVVKAVNGSVYLSGTVRDAATAAIALQVARRFVTSESANGPGIINQIKVIGGQQVLLQVRVSEVTRQAKKIMGLDSAYATPGGTVIGTSPTVAQYGRSPDGTGWNGGNSPLTNAMSALGTSSNATGFFSRSLFGGAFTGVLNALESEGMARTLSEPNLVSVSGKTASMLAGGQYPVPTMNQQGQISTNYQPFGVSLGFTPTVLSPTAISLDIKTEVSTIGQSVSYPVGTTTTQVPEFDTRRASTTVEVPSGGSIVIAGLLSRDFQNSISGLPGIKDIPIFGQLAQSTQFQNDESELIITVTAYLVDPIDAQKTTTAGYGLKPPSDADIYALNRLTGMFATKPKEAPTSVERNFGYITE